jgi:hypothetical protein
METTGNGGLLVDYGVLVALSPITKPLPPSDPLIIEWRALTVPLLDMIAEKVRHALREEVTLAQVLEMGTWKAGREVARKRRPDGGGPPISIERWV